MASPPNSQADIPPKTLESGQAAPVGTLPATFKSPKELVLAGTLDKGKEVTIEKLPELAKPLPMPKIPPSKRG